VAVAGGVSANSALRGAFIKQQEMGEIQAFIPEFQFTTDNAAMIAIAGYFKFLQRDFADFSVSPYSRSGNRS
jgi:N6-L-threonylcarbamoyladenine synthase